MDVAKFNDKDSIMEMSACGFLNPESSEENDNCGEPPVHPRVGDEYQAVLPPLRSESDNLHESHKTDDISDMHFHFGIGLAVPVSWIQDKKDGIREEVDAFSDNRICRDKSGLEGTKVFMEEQNFDDNKSEYMARNSERHDQYPEIETCEIKFMYEKSDKVCASKDDTSFSDLPTVRQRKYKTYPPLPLLRSSCWTDYERQKFLLGLYVFGRNFIVLKKFVESIEMGNMLAFYYGNFYKSSEFQRWSLYKKVRNRKCIYGQRIFTGWRQHEILSRLKPSTSEEGQSSLQKAAQCFNEETISFEEFVFQLRDIVGMKALIEAIGIGKGKHDLTGTALDYVKANQTRTSNPKIPKGKACSSLLPEEIIKLLKGNFRLSKARSNDLFWEAVWPRLLVKGWHSEEAKDQNYATSKSTLVFLIPGVKKFSRRKLVKGDQYYDSVSDVLNKVASEPVLLEMEADGGKVNNEIQKDLECAMDSPIEGSDQPDSKPQCYVRPKFPNCVSDAMKFTVVDTSLVPRAPFKIRELGSLPTDNAYKSANPSSSDGDSSQGSENESASVQESSNAGMPDNRRLRKGMNLLTVQGSQPHQTNNVLNVLNKKRPKQDTNEQHENANGIQILNGMHQFRRKRTSSKKNYLSPIPKRRMLTACNNSESSHHSSSLSTRQHFKEEMTSHLETIDASETIVADAWAPQSETLARSFVEERPNESVECAASDNYRAVACASGVTLSENRCQRRVLFDLNAPPQCPPEFDASQPYEVENADDQDSPANFKSSPSKSHQQHDDSLGNATCKEVPNHPQVAMNGRRQSTRNRPPTAKALEALASGFLDTGRKVRSYKDPSTYRPSRRARKNFEVSESLPYLNHDNVISEVTDAKVEEVDEECSSYTSENGLLIKAESAGLAYDFLGHTISHFLPNKFME